MLNNIVTLKCMLWIAQGH